MPRGYGGQTPGAIRTVYHSHAMAAGLNATVQGDVSEFELMEPALHTNDSISGTFTFGDGNNRKTS